MDLSQGTTIDRYLESYPTMRQQTHMFICGDFVIGFTTNGEKIDIINIQDMNFFYIHIESCVKYLIDITQDDTLTKWSPAHYNALHHSINSNMNDLWLDDLTNIISRYLYIQDPILIVDNNTQNKLYEKFEQDTFFHLFQSQQLKKWNNLQSIPNVNGENVMCYISSPIITLETQSGIYINFNDYVSHVLSIFI